MFDQKPRHLSHIISYESTGCVGLTAKHTIVATHMWTVNDVIPLLQNVFLICLFHVEINPKQSLLPI